MLLAGMAALVLCADDTDAPGAQAHFDGTKAAIAGLKKLVGILRQ